MERYRFRRTYLGRRREGPGQIPFNLEHGGAALALRKEPRGIVPVGQAKIQVGGREERIAGVRRVVARDGGVAQVTQSAPAIFKYLQCNRHIFLKLSTQIMLEKCLVKHFSYVLYG